MFACLASGVFTVSGNGEVTALGPTDDHSVAPFGPVLCQPGTFSTNGLEPCDPAPAGSYVNTSGATSATLCAAGSYQALVGQIGCRLASLGYFVSVTGAIADSECPSGMTTTSLGSYACATPTASIPPAPSVYWWDDPNPSTPGHRLGLSVIAPTGLAGTFEFYEGGDIPSSGAPLETITITSGGSNGNALTTLDVTDSSRFSVRFTSANSTYVSRDFKRRIAACASGRYSTTGNGPCTLAPAGGYVELPGQTFWSACPPGTYQANQGQMSCSHTEPGSFTDKTGQSSATLCNIGYFQPEYNQTSCIPASIGYFVDSIGAAAQTACPAGFTNASTAQSTCSDVAPTTTTVAATTSTTVTPTTVAKKTPTVPKLAKKVAVGRSTTVTLRNGRNKEGLVTRVSSKSKTCRVTKSSRGYVIRGLKKGRCTLSLSITGDSRYSSVTRTGSITIS